MFTVPAALAKKKKKSNLPHRLFINIRGVFLQQCTWKDICFSVLMQFEFMGAFIKVASASILEATLRRELGTCSMVVLLWPERTLLADFFKAWDKFSYSQLCLTQIWVLVRVLNCLNNILHVTSKVTFISVVLKRKYYSIYMFLVPFGILIADYSRTFRMLSDWDLISVSSGIFQIQLLCGVNTSLQHGTPKNVVYVFFHASQPGFMSKYRSYYNVALGGPFDISRIKPL